MASRANSTASLKKRELPRKHLYDLNCVDLQIQNMMSDISLMLFPLYFLLCCPVSFCKGVCDDKGENNRCITIHLDTFSSPRLALNLSPTNCLVWSSTTIATIEFLTSIDIDCKICPISKQHRIGNLMFANTTAKNNHSCFLGLDANVIEPTNVLNKVNDETW
jgi:hypothetical protein